MPIDGYFDVVFAENGDVDPVPDDIQPDGSVSYDSGYGVDYELDPASNPNALNIERTKMNQLFLDITTAIQQYQQHGTPPFITSVMNGGSPYSYSKYDRVLYSGVTYTSLENSNTDTPPSSKWAANDARIRLSANADYYVATTGNDSNPGTSGSPWLTLQHAVDYVTQKIDFNGFLVTINLADGTYTGATSVSYPVVGAPAFNMIINGNAVTPSNAVISTTSSDALLASNTGSGFKVQNLKVQTTTSGSGIRSNNGAEVILGAGMVFGACATAHLRADSLGIIGATANYTINGASAYHLITSDQGLINNNANITVTVSGTPAFSGAFAAASLLSQISMTSITYSGSATGKRYDSINNSVINTSGGGANYFPGNAGGTTGTGGLYL